MTEGPFSPEEFVRLLSLPEDHPERLRAESSGRLEAWRRMLHEFESPSAPIASPAELAAADRALEHGMARAIDARPRVGAGAPVAAPVGGGILSRLATALSRPAIRPAFAMVMIAITVGGFWWAGTRHLPRAVRSGDGENAIVVTARAGPDGALELAWASVPGAEAYRVRFFGATLREIARLDDVPGPRLRLERGSLPTGLRSGAEAMVEVAAVRGGDVIAISSAQAVRLP